ncbi:hypothetical protein BGW38_001740, partial [Lunasporangiospora selenospora]
MFSNSRLGFSSMAKLSIALVLLFPALLSSSLSGSSSSSSSSIGHVHAAPVAGRVHLLIGPRHTHPSEPENEVQQAVSTEEPETNNDEEDEQDQEEAHEDNDEDNDDEAVPVTGLEGDDRVDNDIDDNDGNDADQYSTKEDQYNDEGPIAQDFDGIPIYTHPRPGVPKLPPT